MKKLKIMLWLVAVLWAGSIALAYNPYGLVTRYTFNEAAGTAVVNSSTRAIPDGLMLNGTGFVLSSASYAAHFDGIDDEISYGGPSTVFSSTRYGNPPNRPPGMTIEAWVRADDVNRQESIIFGSGESSIDSVGYGLRHALAVGDGHFIAMFGGWNSNGNDRDRIISGPINSNQWYHVVGTFSGTGVAGESRMELYIDGQLAGSVNPTVNTYNKVEVDWVSGIANESAYLVQGVSGSAHAFAGDIDQINLYDTGLTAEEVLASYNAGPVGIPEPATISLIGFGCLFLCRRKV